MKINYIYTDTECLVFNYDELIFQGTLSEQLLYIEKYTDDSRDCIDNDIVDVIGNVTLRFNSRNDDSTQYDYMYVSGDKIDR